MQSFHYLSFRPEPERQRSKIDVIQTGAGAPAPAERRNLLSRRSTAAAALTDYFTTSNTAPGPLPPSPAMPPNLVVPKRSPEASIANPSSG